MRKKYDSSVIFLYASGKEHLLPDSFRKKIPYTTIVNWRRIDYSNFIGHEFRSFFEEALDKAELSFRYTKIKCTMMSFARAWVILSSVLQPVIKTAGKDKKIRKNILEAIAFMQKYLGVDRTLKLLGISRTLYQQWILQARFECFDSFTSLCVKRHPHQLEMDEVKKIKTLLTSPELDHWPICSVAGFALRKKSIIASLYTWYKYASLMNITKKPPKKRRKTVGIVSVCPNEYLHVDTTYYPLTDTRNVCITFVMDNYSKMILGFQVAEHVSFRIVKKALAKAVKVIARHPQQDHSFLVADGGTENHNKQINTFLSKISGHRITKIRALRDIRFSNSPVEAVHRTMKGRYLRGRKFNTLKSLNDFLEWAVRDYNTIWPHYRHRPRTPQEVYFNTPLGFDIRARVKKAISSRVNHHRRSECSKCKGFCKKH